MTDHEQTAADPLVRPHRRPRDYLGLVLRGFLMGSADLVPGVSGGTIALLLGIYRELIESIRSVARPPFWRSLARLRPREALEVVNAPFLLAVLSGIVLALLLLGRGLEHLIDHYPELLWSFFFGLVVATIFSLRRRVRDWRPGVLVALALGAAASYSLVGLLPAQTPETAWFIFLAGAITICAMILPGVSGAFILVFLGKYQYMVSAVNNRDLATIALFAAGAAVGIVSFAQVLGWLFRRFRDLTLAALVGVMLGSLRKLWPWKSGPLPVVDEFGVTLPAIERNVLPPLFSGGEVNLTIILALALAFLGVLAVLGLERLAGPGDPDTI
jgi:putative membrane protein